jgi:hypothetical protein
VAHELRAPVALQRTLIEVTLADPDADAVALREMGERVLASCEQQQRVIDALLELVRSGPGRRRHEPVDLATIAAEALQAADLGGLEQVLALERAWTTGDPDLLERLAGNLVSNAIRHNIVGGGSRSQPVPKQDVQFSPSPTPARRSRPVSFSVSFNPSSDSTPIPPRLSKVWDSASRSSTPSPSRTAPL